MTTPTSVINSTMNVLPLVLIAAVVLSVPGKAASIQSNPDREGAFRDYRGDSAHDDNTARHLDSTGGRHMLRALDGQAHFPRRIRSGLDSLSGVTFGWNKRLDSLSGITFGNQKRNFDEIDRTGFNGFAKKNFDEIDRSGFDGFVKKNFDEIDRVGFGSFVKRNAPLILYGNYDKEDH